MLTALSPSAVMLVSTVTPISSGVSRPTASAASRLARGRP